MRPVEHQPFDNRPRLVSQTVTLRQHGVERRQISRFERDKADRGQGEQRREGKDGVRSDRVERYHRHRHQQRNSDGDAAEKGERAVARRKGGALPQDHVVETGGREFEGEGGHRRRRKPDGERIQSKRCQGPRRRRTRDDDVVNARTRGSRPNDAGGDNALERSRDDKILLDLRGIGQSHDRPAMNRLIADRGQLHENAIGTTIAGKFDRNRRSCRFRQPADRGRDRGWAHRRPH